jgi:release factor glutamine methyltransferase
MHGMDVLGQDLSRQDLSGQEGQDLWQWRRVAKQRAIAADVSPGEVDWLLQAAGADRLALSLESVKTETLRYSLAELEEMWTRRIEEKTPVQYLVGETAWRQFTLRVSPAVLIPRPETEELVDLAIALAAHDPVLTQGHWVDLGTGSGAIAIGLAAGLPQATIHAVDVSCEALAIAQENAQRLGLPIRFHQGEWFEPLSDLKGNLSAMISNPPYIPSRLIATLQPEVADHEPQLALDGGADGLDCIRQLIGAAPDYLRSGGLWAIELMAGQAEAVCQMLEEQGQYQAITSHVDLNGIDRFVSAFRV